MKITEDCTGPPQRSGLWEESLEESWHHARNSSCELDMASGLTSGTSSTCVSILLILSIGMPAAQGADAPGVSESG